MTKLKTLTRLGDNWVEGTYKEFFFQAKVYPTKSEFGINEGRVSKLTVCNGNKWNSKQVVFNYDRGLEQDSKIGYEIANLLETI